MSAGRLAAYLRNHVLHRALPHGIVSLRYLVPCLPEKALIHRRLWLKGRHPRIPRPLFLIIEFLLWLRWVSFACWYRSWKAVRHRGRKIAELEGIGRAKQLGYLLHMGLCHCIPPGEVYAFRLYRPESKRDFWDYVFIHEIHAFHHWRGRKTGKKQESLAMLQDKIDLSEFLDARGVPMAPILGMVPRGGAFDPAPYLRTHSRIFCKPRRGSASRDAFVIENRGQGITVFAVKSGVKKEATTHDCLRKAMARDDFLIQPFLKNHSVFAGLCPTEDVITLRVITENHPIRGMECYSATLEIPNTSEETGKGHIILPIEPLSGLVMRFPRSLPPSGQARHDAIYERIGNQAVPFWERIRQSAKLAHMNFTDIYAIAWDYVITPEGPVMLEGNTGWGATTPQMLHGGLLNNEIITG